MYNRTVIATALAAALASSGVNAAADRMSDTWQEASIATAITLNEHLNPFDIDVEVRDDIAYLQGVVESEVEKSLAGNIAASVEGVAAVRNNLQVKADVERRSTRSDFSRTVEDATITARVKSQLLWNQATGGLDINVVTKSGVVHLDGAVDSTAERVLVREIAGDTSGVLRVEDSLEVKPAVEPTATARLKSTVATTATALERDASDAWVTTKVKSALLYNRAVDGTDISVETEGGVVILTGTVTNEAERLRAVRIASQVKGVRNVQAYLEITADS